MFSVLVPAIVTAPVDVHADVAPLILTIPVAPALAPMEAAAVVTCPPLSAKRLPLPVSPTIRLPLFVHFDPAPQTITSAGADWFALSMLPVTLVILELDSLRSLPL